MTRALPLLLVAALASSAAAADWRKSLTTPQPGAFPPPRPLTAHYTCGWSAFTAAEIETAFSRVKGGLFQLEVTANTVGAVRALWRLDADHTSLVRADTLQPVSLVQNETYSDGSMKTSVVFDAEGAARTRETTPHEEDSGKTKRFKFSPLFDLHGALLFIRSQPLKTGSRIRLVAYPAAQAYLTEVNVLGRETVKVAGEKRPAIKLALRLQRITKKLELEPHTKFKRAQLWVSDDADRLLLKVDAEVMVGKVWMELTRVEFAK